ncbi:putative bifunctional diguanylate cyclase/phosphodiesterase [Rhizobium wuzhouense]|uniref:GGDEF-domain containing protein n=1 Tax=Rhizobium wuzhouense TaxID=1986026 RepID=A0ABX5NSZ4_9HYPH|nr:EAL domain-containing protein [Rhizobium wuzhouense]PYB75118.1 GGDEF-domain containing protein [Rhizobium wuzhouense]
MDSRLRRNGGFPLAILQAQVADIERGYRSILTANVAAHLAVLLLLHINGGIHWASALWFAFSMAAIIFREISLSRIRRAGLHISDPSRCLSILALGAFLHGMIWAGLPLAIADFEPLGQHTPIMMIMGGMATGSIVRQFGYTPLALAYAVPILLSQLLSLAHHGGSSDLIVGACLAILMIVFIRRSLWAERIFVNSQIARHEATTLADSLTRANSDILRQNTRLEALANRDTLTGLSNRMFFHGRLTGDIARAAVLSEAVALLIFDVERFQAINDTLGHSAGDALLREIGARLEALIGDGSLIARLGGDEFAVIVSGNDAIERARAHANRVIEASRTPIGWGQHRAIIGLSVGLATYPDHAGTAEELLICADMALYEAKRGDRRKPGEFDPELRLNADRKRRIEQDLCAAIDSGAVGAWFQPQLDLATRRITGFEALVRWQHPQLGFIAPPDIVNAAQAMHLSERLTARIAADACVLARQLPDFGLKNASVALNVSPREFALYSVADMLEKVTADHGVWPSALEIEITEEAILDPALADAQLKRLEEAGYKLAVDDFGMGHSSLAYLISLKVDRLKIDRSFVKDVARCETNQKLVTAMVSLGHSLDLDIVVEGVETNEDAAVLARLGCTVAQGYLFARPMPPRALATWIAEHQTTAIKRKRKTGHLSVA